MGCSGHTSDEVKSTSWHERYLEKIIDPADLETTADALRERGKKIATLNGSFDLLHAGHLHILYEASRAGDVLLVALNSDESIKSYKSVSRPIIPLECRMQMVAALEFVDFVTFFSETDPRAVLSKIKPDVHVNGSEWGQECIEAETVRRYGGTIHIVGLVPGLSTTEIVNKIKIICD